MGGESRQGAEDGEARLAVREPGQPRRGPRERAPWHLSGVRRRWRCAGARRAVACAGRKRSFYLNRERRAPVCAFWGFIWGFGVKPLSFVRRTY